MKEGIDVSYYQGDIDWSKIKTDFVYIKEGQGINSPDPKCKTNAMGCQAFNIPFGYYHFATLNNKLVVNDAVQEAKWVLNHLTTLPKPTLTLALDVETNQAYLAPSEVELWIRTFIQTLNKPIILYSGYSWLNENLPPNHSLGSIPLWLAEYTSASVPILPKGWHDFVIWQYSESGKMLGINGNVDLNRAKNLN